MTEPHPVSDKSPPESAGGSAEEGTRTGHFALTSLAEQPPAPRDDRAVPPAASENRASFAPRDDRASPRLWFAALAFAGLTLLSRVLGWLRDAVQAFLLGTGATADAFAVALLVPNLFRRLVAEGAASQAFVPVFSEWREKHPHGLPALVHAAAGTLLVGVGLLVLAGVVLAPIHIPRLFAPGFTDDPIRLNFAVGLNALLFPYLLCVALAALAQAAQNAKHVFAPTALQPVVLNLTILAVALGFGVASDEPVIAMAWGYLLGGVAQVAYAWSVLPGLGIPWGLRWGLGHEGVRRMLTLMGPGLLAAGIYPINVALAQAIASTAGGGAVSALSYSSRLMELPLGVFVVGFSTVLLPRLSELVARGDTVGFRSAFAQGVRMTLFVCLPATGLMMALAEPLVGLLFGRGAFDATSVRMTAGALMAHAAGLCFVGLTRIQLPAFYAGQDTRTPLGSSVLALGVNVGLAWSLVDTHGHVGVAAASSCAALAQAMFLAWAQSRRGLDPDWKAMTGPLTMMIAAAGAATTTAWGIIHYGAGLYPFAFSPDFPQSARWGLQLALGGFGGGLVYAAVAFAAGLPELRSAWRRFRRRSNTG